MRGSGGVLEVTPSDPCPMPSSAAAPPERWFGPEFRTIAPVHVLHKSGVAVEESQNSAYYYVHGVHLHVAENGRGGRGWRNDFERVFTGHFIKSGFGRTVGGVRWVRSDLPAHIHELHPSHE